MTTTDPLEIERAYRGCRALAPADLYTVLRTGLGQRRGWHVYRLHGDGAPGCYPRTTAADVARLTALWRRYLREHSPTTSDRWERVADQADRLCATVDEGVEYPRNRIYWRALRELAVASRARNESDALNAWRTVVVTDDHGTLRVSGENVAFTDVQRALREHFGERRGWDTLTVQNKKDGSTREHKWPRTTCQDVAQLAAYWTGEVARAPKNYDEMVPGTHRRTWAAAVAASAVHCAVTSDGVYPENRAFWKAMQGAAVAIDVENDNVPRSKFDAVIGTFSHVISTIGSGLSDAASWTGDRFKGAARTVGEGAGGLFDGFLDAIGFKELLIGAGLVLGAIVIVPKLMDKDSKE
jgi:hypothetical protein